MEDKQDRRHSPNWPTRLLIIALVGVVIYVTGLIIGGKPGLDEVAKDIGVGLGVAVLIGFVVDRLLHQALLREIDKGISRLEKGSEVLRGSATSHIKDIFARRGSDEDRSRSEARIRSAIRSQIEKRSGDLLIACVAAPQFFRNDNSIGMMLWDEFPRNTPGCALRVLLMCPASEAATERAQLEAPHPTLADIAAAGTFLCGLKGQVPDRVKVQCYSTQAVAFLVITDSTLFLEPYPLARLDRSEVPLGGRSPMLVFDRDSEAFSLWKRHFEYLWGKSVEYCAHHPSKTKSVCLRHSADEATRAADAQC